MCRGKLGLLIEPTPAPEVISPLVNKPGSESEGRLRFCCGCSRLGKNVPEPCLTNSGFPDIGDEGIVLGWGAEFDCDCC